MSASTIALFKALGDETRLAIVSFLARKKVASCKEVSEKFHDLSQPTMSHHFKVLAEARIITVTKEGTERRYALNDALLARGGVDVRKLL